MAQVTPGELYERVLGRTWTVRLDAASRGSTAVRVSCNRPACVPERLPTTATGRTAAVAHLKAHLKALAAPRAEAFCICKAEHCHLHTPARFDERPERGEPWRCGGPVVLAVVTDREGRWWQAMECCSRCAAAIPGAKTIATAPPAPRAVHKVAGIARPAAAFAVGPQFSDRSAAGAPRLLPAARSTPRSFRPPRDGRIAGHTVPYRLRPTELRDELMELGDLFRSYQQRTEPDLALLADLHARKAAAFTTWAEVTSDTRLRREARRAEQAARAARLQHQQRTSRAADDADDGQPAVVRVLTGFAMWEHARSVLAYCAEHAPLPGPEVRLLVVMVTLRTAHTGTGNLVGQDLTALGLTDPKSLVEQLTGCGWLALPASADDLLASRPEDSTPITIPSLLPNGGSRPGPFTFGRKTRPKLSGWAQKVVADKKIRQTKATAGARLLALILATQTSPHGHLGPCGHGLALATLASLSAADGIELPGLLDQLTAADWLTDSALSDTHLTGRLSERVLPFTCPLPALVPEEAPV
ncbi:hypothetical protein [Streptomyces sp. NPDC059819]|uniref:hypothetical protein n=1 Tax=Streptomyces sp. NPDC059819 TaxID=3346963 RepID=UPI003657928D